jgi:hypothetical protein
MKTVKTSLIALALAAPSALLFQGCELEEGCTVNSQCGQDYLCRDNECIPRCVTYLTCAEGEACVDGACQIPPADYCDYIAPAHAPDGGVYLPCPVTGGAELSVGGAQATGGTEAPVAGTETPVAGTGSVSSAGAESVAGGAESPSAGTASLSPVGGAPSSDAGTDTLP